MNCEFKLLILLTRGASNHIMDEKCLVGVDVGTTSVKAIAVNLEGKQLASSRAPIPLYSPARHQYIQDAGEMRDSIFQALRILTAQISGFRVEGVGVTGQSISLIIADRGGRQIHPIINHLDTRAITLLHELEKTVGPLGYVGVKLVGNLNWVRRFKPEVWKMIGMVMDVKEYAGYLLTGQPSSDRIWYQIEDLERYFRELDMPIEWLGRPTGFTEVLGHVSETAHQNTGLPTGTPVIISLGDSLISPYGSGVVREGDMADVCGATEIMAAATSSAHGIVAYPYLLAGLKIASHSPPIGLIHKWIVERMAELLGVELEKAYVMFENMAEEAGPGGGGVIFLPGSFRPTPKMFNIAFTDITYSNDIRQIARAFYECSVFELKRTVEVFEEAGCRVSRIVVSGGAATPFWCQLKADILGREIETPAVTETGCLGAALTAGYTLGLYPSLEQAASVVRIAKVYRPSKTYDYGKRYSQYLTARERCGQLL
jgi:xylulokinase